MKIAYRADPDSRLLVYYLPGDTTQEDIMEVVREISQHDAYLTYSDLTILEELTEASVAVMKSQSASVRQAFGDEGGFRSAFVVSSRKDFGLIRVYLGHRHRDPEDAQVFYDIQPALEWLGVREDRQQQWLDTIDEMKREAGS